jgi:glucose-6-phosphate 1-dehydrogenase
MIARLALFGATGDLAGRYLLPALAALRAAGELPGDFELTGAAQEGCDDESFRRHAADRLAEHAADTPRAAREALVQALRYRPVDVTDAASVAAVVDTGGEPIAAYLALPPALFAPTATALATAGLAGGSRIAFEKPFGDDPESARQLNALLGRLFGDATERTIFRVDHALGMPTVRNLLELRRSSRVLDAVWSSDHVEEVQILWEEQLALEGRAEYYDHTGALKDVLQNHMLQVLAVLAMEPEDDADGASLHDRKTELLRSLMPPANASPSSWSRRARYTAGRIGDRVIPSYVDEDGVDPARSTETFAELVLYADTDRWAGTRFVLRAGKALGQRHKEAVLRFRPAGGSTSDELRIGIDGPTDLALRLSATSGGRGEPQTVDLTGSPPDPGRPPYANVLLDLLTGSSRLSVAGDAAVAAWQVVAPALEAWAAGAVPLEEYVAGSRGPTPRT